MKEFSERFVDRRFYLGFIEWCCEGIIQKTSCGPMARVPACGSVAMWLGRGLERCSGEFVGRGV